ncbi:restriction endonuclease subunit S [Aquimarina latercula]|uniref:restriction endonuclease subunit S n=1 Tax=Aquimarina latercula TaxID=987 RepID=UPI00040335E2|nr:restriction endonuclease subunit S [Aquimarina latercula]
MNYKRLGDYIQPVNIRNKELEVTTLLGVSIKKVLMSSIANTIGTNMKTYKIIEKNQFAYGPVTSRNGDKISIALLEDFEKAIVSQAYTVFEVIDEQEVLPQYLMMWFRRPEFDRFARFKSHGSAREVFDWEELCDTQLPIPSIEKQQQIVAEYNTVTHRIQLNEKINTNLEATAQALYKHWFVDFEFPNEDGKPYKSSGGDMIYNKELDKDIPVGWSVESVKDFSLDMKSGATPNRSEIDYWNSNDYSWIKTGELKNSVIINSEESISALGLKNSSTKLLPINSVLIAMYGQGNTKGQVGYLKIEATTNQACCAMICKDENYSTFLYYHLRVNRNEIVKDAIGGAQPNLSKELIEKICIIKPTEDILIKTPFVEILNSRWRTSLESQKLKELQSLLLAKMTQVELKPQTV